MSKKPRLPSFKLNYQELNERLGRYCTEVQVLYDKLASSAAQKVLANTHYDGSSPFLFDAFPELAKTANDLQADFATSLKALVTSYTSKEWKQSNLLQDLVADKALAAYKAKIKGREQKIYYQPNSDALKAFQNRVSNGMNLSANIWQQSEGAMRELEGALSVSIEKGTDAKTVSKRVSKYLKDFPSLQKDYTEQFGKANDIHDCEYRSIRLARSEINMAYRSAEQERWKQFDFIKGYEVKTSGSHPQPDICDDLAGKYPKDFVFLGWHPNCMCYVVPIVMSEDEYWDYQDAKDEDPEAQPDGYITEMPKEFNEYVKDNEERIMSALSRGTAPYWVRDNAEYVGTAMERGTRAVYPGTTGQFRSLPSDNGQNVVNKIPVSQQEQNVGNLSSISAIADYMAGKGIEYREVSTLTETLTEKEIVGRVGKHDGTQGSCASVALAYLANKRGYNVLDFRGGESELLFSDGDIWRQIAKNVGGIISTNASDYSTAAKLLSNVVEGKDYILSVGRHTAVIRKTGKTIEYLELQENSFLNGFTKLDKNELRDRFGCCSKRTHKNIPYSLTGELIDSNLLFNDEGIKRLLGYLNTAENKQKIRKRRIRK